MYNNNWHGFVTLNYPVGYSQASNIYRYIAGKYVVFNLTRKQSLLHYFISTDSKQKVKMSIFFLGSIWYSKHIHEDRTIPDYQDQHSSIAGECSVLLRSACPVPDGWLHIKIFFFKIFCTSFFQYLSCRSMEIWGWKSEHNCFFNQLVTLKVSYAGPWIFVFWKILVNLSEMLLTHSRGLDPQFIVALFPGRLHRGPDWIHDSHV